MPRKSMALAAAVALSSALFTAGQATAASSAQRADRPPFPYADCVKEVKKQHKATDRRAREVCDMLVKKGWIKPPKS
ncbi:hypothetical protein ABZY93_07590 [Streptomyces smyrnaeus]|uniref:hypothetical protein n=1 Tax=Streptomyces smyrnaeus TaxID=1387713 RepID=UPI0033A539FF